LGLTPNVKPKEKPTRAIPSFYDYPTRFSH